MAHKQPAIQMPLCFDIASDPPRAYYERVDGQRILVRWQANDNGVVVPYDKLRLPENTTSWSWSTTRYDYPWVWRPMSLGLTDARPEYNCTWKDKTELRLPLWVFQGGNQPADIPYNWNRWLRCVVSDFQMNPGYGYYPIDDHGYPLSGLISSFSPGVFKAVMGYPWDQPPDLHADQQFGCVVWNLGIYDTGGYLDIARVNYHTTADTWKHQLYIVGSMYPNYVCSVVNLPEALTEPIGTYPITLRYDQNSYQTIAGTAKATISWEDREKLGPFVWTFAVCGGRLPYTGTNQGLMGVYDDDCRCWTIRMYPGGPVNPPYYQNSQIGMTENTTTYSRQQWKATCQVRSSGKTRYCYQDMKVPIQLGVEGWFILYWTDETGREIARWEKHWTAQPDNHPWVPRHLEVPALTAGYPTFLAVY